MKKGVFLYVFSPLLKEADCLWSLVGEVHLLLDRLWFRKEEKLLVSVFVIIQPCPPQGSLILLNLYHLQTFCLRSFPLIHGTFIVIIPQSPKHPDWGSSGMSERVLALALVSFAGISNPFFMTLYFCFVK